MNLRWLVSLMLTLVMLTPALAGETPYIAIVGNDLKDLRGFYFSPKYQQFMYDQEDFSVPVCDPLQDKFPAKYTQIGKDSQTITYGGGCEQFRSKTPVVQPEVCDINGYTEGVNYFSDYGLPNSVTKKGFSGWYEWYVRLPETPAGEIDLVLQCGVLKPGAFAFLDYDAVSLCAAETGETSDGLCVRTGIRRGENPVKKYALPEITAKAYPGPYSDFTEFNLTAFRNPGTYNPFLGRQMVNGDAAQVLDGSERTRILLKSCMDETVVVKMPVSGQINGNGQTETALVAGDIIWVRMDIPLANTVDIFCHEQSLKVMGIGESPF